MNYETTEEYEFDSHRPATTSGGTSVKAGWVIAQVALTMTGLVLCFLLGYVLFSKRQRRLALERYEQQQQEQQRQDMVKSQERAKTIQETLQWVVYRSFVRTFISSSRSGGSSSGGSTCSSSDDSEASTNRTTSNNATNTGCMIQRDLDFDGETEEDDHVLDIEAQECIRGNSNNNNNNSNDYDEHEEHCCSICFGAYEPDHQIGISSNQECLHAFHRECITEWLLQHDECPVCRRSYLGAAADDDDDDVENDDVEATSDNNILRDINC